MYVLEDADIKALHKKKDKSVRRRLDRERQKAFGSGDITIEELQTVQLVEDEMEMLSVISNEDLYERIQKKLLCRTGSYIRRHPKLMIKPYNQLYVQPKINSHIQLFGILCKNYRVRYYRGQYLLFDELRKVNLELEELFGPDKPIALYDENEDERFIMPSRGLKIDKDKPKYEDVSDLDLPVIPKSGPLALVKMEDIVPIFQQTQLMTALFKFYLRMKKL
jgi:hypothetical protein